MQRFWYITVPSVKPITYMVITLSVIQSFQIFDVVYQLTHGGPGTSTELMATYMYKKGFTEFQMGYASTIAAYMFLICFIFACCFLYATSRKGEN